MLKYVNLVDLVKSFPASIYLQKSASIQPRTSPSKLGGNYSILYFSYVHSIIFSFFNSPLFLNLLFEQIANSNEYLLAKIGVDTAENELLEVLFNIIQYYSFVSLTGKLA